MYKNLIVKNTGCGCINCGLIIDEFEHYSIIVARYILNDLTLKSS